MYKIFKILSVLFTCYYFCTYSFADWTFYKNAIVRSKEGHIFGIEKIHSGIIRAFIKLNKKNQVNFASKLPLYQVDENEVHDLQLIKKGRVEINTKDKRVRWLIYSGKGLLSDALLEFINGKEVTFQVYLTDGTIKETTFNLRGAREAIQEILR